MTREEKNKLLQTKAAELLAWFEGRELPAAPFMLESHAQVINTRKFFDSMVRMFTTYHERPTATQYVQAYFNLTALRSFMEGTHKIVTNA